MRKSLFFLATALVLCACSSESLDHEEEGKVFCGNFWIDPLTDNAFCGAKDDCAGENAGQACAEGQTCQNGTCTPVCKENELLCGNACIDPLSDMAFCGAKDDCAGENAGQACAEGQICQNGICTPVCKENELLCGDTCIDPLSDMTFCGAKDDCAGENAGQACVNGYSCVDGACVSGCLETQILCDQNCVDPATDNTYCGAKDDCLGDNKGVVCDVGYECNQGECKSVCDTGYLFCNEKCIDPMTDSEYCGAVNDCTGENKGKTCDSGTVCKEGQCVSLCTAEETLCNDTCVNLNTDANHCGACGNTCASGKCVEGSCTCEGSSQCNTSSALCVDQVCSPCHLGDVIVDSACPKYDCIIGTVTFTSTTADQGVFGCDSVHAIKGDIIGPTSESYSSISFENLEYVDGNISMINTPTTSYNFNNLAEVTGEVRFENLTIDELNLPKLATVGSLIVKDNTYKSGATQEFGALANVKNSFEFSGNKGISTLKFGALQNINNFTIHANDKLTIWLTGIKPTFQYLEIVNPLSNAFFWSGDINGEKVVLSDDYAPCSLFCELPGFTNFKSMTCAGEPLVCK